MKSKKKKLKNHFSRVVCNQEDFFEKLSLFKLIFYLKANQNIFKNVRKRVINCFNSNIGF